MDRIGGYVAGELIGLGASGSVWSASRDRGAECAFPDQRMHVGGAGAAVGEDLRQLPVNGTARRRVVGRYVLGGHGLSVGGIG